MASHRLSASTGPRPYGCESCPYEPFGDPAEPQETLRGPTRPRDGPTEWKRVALLLLISRLSQTPNVLGTAALGQAGPSCARSLHYRGARRAEPRCAALRQAGRRGPRCGGPGEAGRGATGLLGVLAMRWISGGP